MTDLSNSTIFPKGTKVATNFIGDAYLEMLVQGDELFDVPVGNVTFAPGARNNWHVHEKYQILLVTGGTGYYQEEGKPAQVLREGDVVQIPAGVKHWHGATASEWFVHLAMTKGATTWLEEVSDQQYHSI
ncbi:cupin domain-containing protein [Carnobacterium gallinarum]|uniref:cupin domain-containing protein n=1 Tax=Carnobacterium gallinarum TaxID=2749 RepID=UPI000556C574|nr:cupin domain-containing protein [Carnobacterium gallinarum]